MDFRKLLLDERSKNMSSKCITNNKCTNKFENQENTIDNTSKCFNNSIILQNNNIESYKIGDIPSLYYINEVISELDEKLLYNEINKDPLFWTQLRTRKLQYYGPDVDPTGNNHKPIPNWLQSLFDSLINNNIFDTINQPNHILINQYKSNEGIMHHTDGPNYYPKVIIISLFSKCLMTFRYKLQSNEIGNQLNNDLFSVMLQPRSLLIFQDDLYHIYMHGISTDEIQIVNDNIPCVNMIQANVVSGDIVSTVHTYNYMQI